jgi:predicted TIM-barrel fold metal-dependent hydrolase
MQVLDVRHREARMVNRDDDKVAEIPSILQRLHTDEYTAPGYDATQQAAVAAVVAAGESDARSVRRALGEYWSSRLGTAAGLRALNEAFDVSCYAVPPEAAFEQDAADEALGGSDLVIDVQTHFMADREYLRARAETSLIPAYRSLGPDWWSGLDGVTFYGFADYLRCIFLESDTAVAVLTAQPADDEGGHFLTNDEMAIAREVVDRFAGTGRLLNHTVVHPTDPAALDNMERWRDKFQPVGWKVYTMGHLPSVNHLADGWEAGTEWMLDDDRYGLPFLERARELDVRVICTHKGLSGLVDNGSPRDIGPCARMFPDLDFLVYHSGFEGVAAEEGPYTEATANEGINRLITTVRENGIEPGGNVYAELGTTWYCMIKRPIEAAHVIGKLLLAVGEDNVLWGTDGVWYGNTQPVVDAFRAFEIPPEMSEQFGYPQLTAEIKAKILGLNAARVYNIDTAAARARFESDDLTWSRAALAAFREESAG